MAPQETASYYGAVVMDREAKAAPAVSPLAKRVAVAVLAAVAVVGFVAMSGSSSQQQTAVVDIAQDSMPDCVCTSDCQYVETGVTDAWFDPSYTDQATFIAKSVMMCPVADNECRDVTYDRSEGTRGTPLMYGTATYVAVCENFDTACNLAGDACGPHGYCVAKGQDASIDALQNHREYNCMCDPGWEEVGGACVNIDECSIGTHECDINAVCTDMEPTGAQDTTPTSLTYYGCECNYGFSGAGWACDDIDRCLTADCGNVAMIEVCITTDETGACTATEMQQDCVDASALSDPDGYDCHCAIGWLESDPDCLTDIDECELNQCPLNTQCTNTDGSYYCECKENWMATADIATLESPDDLVCIPYDFCTKDAPCENGGTCTNGPNGCGHDETDAAAGGALEWMAAQGNPGNRDDKFDEFDFGPKDCYSCECVDGWEASRCEVDVDECQGEHGCDPNSDCVNTAGSYECICHLGWYMATIGGTRGSETAQVCKDIDDCADTQPCAHGGTCIDCGTLCFTCTCVAGWRGTTCATDWNECTMGIHICNDDATCKNNPGSYDCKCDAGFTGTGLGGNNVALTEYIEDTSTTEDERSGAAAQYLADLSEQPGCIDINDCAYNAHESPCKNGAACADIGTDYYKCTCTAGWTDSDCDTDINECNPAEVVQNKCSPFAKCVNKNQLFQNSPAIAGYECVCLEGYSGDGVSCIDIDDCVDGDTRRCEAHGFCKDQGVDFFKCQCDDGWIGQNCDDDENECVTGKDNCGRNAICKNTDGSFTCECKTGYSGDPTTTGASGCTDIDDCAATGANPCKNGATCTDVGIGHYTCECPVGWVDKTCDFDVNECLSEEPCPKDSSCHNTDGSYECICLSGYSPLLEDDKIVSCTDIDDCNDGNNGGCKLPAVCDSGVTSGLISGNARVCHCPEGWQGCGSPFCELDCEDCPKFKTDASVCTEVAGGTCTQVCREGYFGAEGDCAIECKPCSGCGIGYFIATPCSATKDGDDVCQNIDECARDTDMCEKPHAGCQDTDGSYICQCESGFWGNGYQKAWNKPAGFLLEVEKYGCDACTECQEGFHETQPCTSISDRVCEIDLPAGPYMIESEADGNKMCVAIQNDEWYPTRVNEGNGDNWCGLSIGEDFEGKETEVVKSNPAFVWYFSNLYNNEVGVDSQLYTISHENMDSTYDGYNMRCMYFGSEGEDIYPTLQSCVDFEDAGKCPWGNGQPNPTFDSKLCDFQTPTNSDQETEVKLGLIANGQAVFNVQAVKVVEKKYIIQANARDGDGWDCLAFEDSGAATNPSRYNWGNGEDWCGVGDWDGYGKEMALLNNKQAVFILTKL